MQKTGRGVKIINIASKDALRPTGYISAYSASKAGVVMITKAMAKELAPNKIHVNTIAPGGIDTPMLRSWASSDVEADELILSAVQSVPLGRFGLPDDIEK